MVFLSGLISGAPKRGFLGFRFFNKDETHPVNLFSCISPPLETFRSRSQLQGMGTVDTNMCLTTKPVPDF